ncbi:MAG: hypothetical protein RL660_227 [Bacteroidota bacterium]|jgi:hypothetical protein
MNLLRLQYVKILLASAFAILLIVLVKSNLKQQKQASLRINLAENCDSRIVMKYKIVRVKDNFFSKDWERTFSLETDTLGKSYAIIDSLAYGDYVLQTTNIFDNTAVTNITIPKDSAFTLTALMNADKAIEQMSDTLFAVDTIKFIYETVGCFTHTKEVGVLYRNIKSNTYTLLYDVGSDLNNKPSAYPINVTSQFAVAEIKQLIIDILNYNSEIEKSTKQFFSTTRHYFFCLLGNQYLMLELNQSSEYRDNPFEVFRDKTLLLLSKTNDY